MALDWCNGLRYPADICNMDANQTAQTIIQQIGPGALMRIGAHSFLTDDDRLIMHSGRGHRSKIIIDYSRQHDSYTVTTLRIKRDLSLLEREVATGVYCDQLSQIIADLG